MSNSFGDPGARTSSLRASDTQGTTGWKGLADVQALSQPNTVPESFIVRTRHTVICQGRISRHKPQQAF